MSIGLTPLLADDDHEKLIARADGACYQAKQAGRGQVRIAQPGETTGILQALHPDGPRQLLDSDNIQLLNHPIYALDPATGVDHHHLLAPRLRSPQDQWLNYHELLAIATQYHIIPELSRQLLHLGLQRADQLLGPDDPSWVAIPVAIAALRDPDLPLFLARSLAETDLQPGQICLAIDEPGSVLECQLMEAFIQRLRGLGCRFMLNHFGRELGALNWLSRLAVDYLKLDIRLTHDLHQPVALQSIATIVELCRLLNIGTIASGVDNTEIAERLQALDVEYAEGEIFNGLSVDPQ